MSSSDVWSQETADHYDESSSFMFAPEVLDPCVDALERLAEGGPVLEFAIGTGRVAVPLAERGLPVAGIELSAPMAAKVAEKRDDISVVVGDMATTRVDGEFSLVFVAWNSLGNVRTQPEQVEVFRNAARHLAPGGRFVVELWIPGIRRFPPGQAGVPFHVGEHHVGLDTYDMTTQQGTSHHYSRHEDGTVTYGASNFRYCWPAELDLMAHLAGLELESRWADWSGEEFTSESESQVSVWRRPLATSVGTRDGIRYEQGPALPRDQLIALYDAVGWTAYTRRPQDFRAMYDAASHAFSAWEGDRLVGVVRVVGDGVTIAHVQDLLVHPDAQRRGIGSHLLQLVLDATTDLRQTLLMTDAADTHVVDLYRGKGFRPMSDDGCLGMALFR